MAEKYLISAEDYEATIEIERDDDGVRVRIEGEDRWRRAHLEQVGDSGLFLLMLDDQPMELYLERRRGGAVVTIGRHIFDYEVEPWRPSLVSRTRARETQPGQHRIIAPMTGAIIEVMRAAGDAVAVGDVVLVVESMKMNNEIRSPAEGVVLSVAVQRGDRVGAGSVLMVIQS